MTRTVMPEGVRIRLLGPIAIAAEEGWQPVNGRRRSAVLAALALQPGETVSADRLAAIVWGDRAPRTAGDTLRNHVSYLRKTLPAGAAIVTRTSGYAMDLDPGATDVEAAEDLIERATRATDARQRESRLRAAVALWQGPPLADLTELTWFGERAERLNRKLLDARRLLLAARLELGEHRQLVAELEILSREHPLDEQLHGQLMVALSRAGRQADALATYQRLYRALDEELGILPEPGLRDLYAAVLRHDAAVTATESPAITTNPASSAHPVPAQLPPTIATFAGRDREAASLDGILARADENTGPVVVSICGTAGVGKTALAVWWAHRMKPRFPDGQLYVNLRGFDPGGLVVDPAGAVRGLLDTLGVPANRVPATFDGQVALYRSLLAGTRMLIVIDNARDEQQVRPMLPGAPGCLVIVTSRNQLPGLVAAEGAHPLTLHRPDVTAARQILARRLGADRVEAEPRAVDEIIARCARLPLALAIAAGRAALDRQSSLSRLAAQLHDATAAPLDSFDNADPATNVRAVFSWSYRILSAPAARLFRLLSLCPAPDVGAPAAASVAGLPRGEVRPLLTELVHAGLLVEPGADRFGFHELLRAYAIEQAHEHDGDGQRAAARHRFLDHHLHTAHAATLLAKPGREPIDLAAAVSDVTPQRLADYDAAQAWFAAERQVLLATVAREADGFDRHTWQLAWALAGFLVTHADRWDNEFVQRASLRAARRLGDPAAAAYAHRSLSRACFELERLTEARRHSHAALRLFELVDNPVAATGSRYNLSTLAAFQGDFGQALAHAEHAYRSYRSLGDRSGQAYAANNIGWCQGKLGHHQEGLAYCREALDILLELGDLAEAANAWDSLGALHFGLGDHTQGEHCYQQAIVLYRRLGDRFKEARMHTDVGDHYQRAGHPAAARRAWRQALSILDDLAPDAAARVRAKLDPSPSAGRPVRGRP